MRNTGKYSENDWQMYKHGIEPVPKLIDCVLTCTGLGQALEYIAKAAEEEIKQVAGLYITR
jgi:hypothetical protein